MDDQKAFLPTLLFCGFWVVIAGFVLPFLQYRHERITTQQRLDKMIAVWEKAPTPENSITLCNLVRQAESVNLDHKVTGC